MDRIFLIEILALALLINAAAILLVLRARWAPQPISSPPANAMAPDQPASVTRRLTPDGVHRAVGVTAAKAPATGTAVTSIEDGGRWGRKDTDEWSDRIRTETTRSRRSGRPAAVVVLRLDGMGALAAGAGPAAADWLRRLLTASVRSCAHVSDLVQDDDRGSYRVLLVDTDDDRAGSYVELVARPLAPWLDDPQAAVRLTAGWAGTCSEPDLETSDRLAHARLAGASAGWIRSAATWRSDDRGRS